MGGFGAFCGEGFIVEVDGACGVEAESELIAPAELEAGFGNGVVALLSCWVTFGEVCGVGCNFVGDDTFTNVVSVREAEVFFRSYVAEHSAAIPADVSGTDTGGDVIVAGGDVGSCLLYTSPSPRDLSTSRMPSSA